jgi:hypothetical protein
MHVRLPDDVLPLVDISTHRVSLSINLPVLNLCDFLPDLVNNVDKPPANVSTSMQLHP